MSTCRSRTSPGGSPGRRPTRSRALCAARSPDRLLRGAMTGDGLQQGLDAAALTRHLSHDRALVEAQDAVADAGELGEVRGVPEDRVALTGDERAHKLVDGGLVPDVDSPRRVVEEQELRLPHQRPGQDRLLL